MRGSVLACRTVVEARAARAANGAALRWIVPALAAGLVFAAIQWLRAPEPPGLAQSLFGFYGHWLGRGLALYRDLWDSKPPGIFVLYAAAERLVGIEPAPRLLDVFAAAVAGAIAFQLLRAAGSSQLA